MPDSCGSDTTVACTSFKCVSSTTRNDGECSGRLANACGYYKDIVCTSAPQQTVSCPTTCAPAATPDDSLCDAGAYCAHVSSSYVCTPKAQSGGNCTAPNQCLGGSCDTTRGICCSGSSCCNAPADCPASYTLGAVCSDPSNCQGTARVASCTDHTCGTASSASRYDSACNYAANSTHYHACPGNFAFYCSGKPLQDAAGGCPTDCSFFVLPCGTACGQVSCNPANQKCAPGFSCTVACANNVCTGTVAAPPSCTGTCG